VEFHEWLAGDVMGQSGRWSQLSRRRTPTRSWKS